MSWDELQLRRYLLGTLSEEETESVDMRVITDATSRDALEAAEQLLIEDYLEGNLPEHESASFKENFLTSDDRLEDFHAVRLLKDYASREVNSPVSGEASRPTLIERFLSGLRPLSVAFGVLVIGLLAFAGWQFLLSDRSSPLEQEYAALNQGELGVDGLGPNSTVQLAPGQLRDSSLSANLRSEALAERVLFRLALPYKPRQDSSFRIELIAGERKLFTIPQARVYSTGTGSEVRVLIPRSTLVKGQEQLRITDTADPDLVQTYHFQVQ